MTGTVAQHFDVLIVGAGHGGAQAAIALRQHGFNGSIAIVGEEPEFPYERPPLSKDYFSGEKTFERIRIRPPQFWQDKQIAMIPNQKVVTVDAARHLVTTFAGDVFHYGRMIWATGGTPRMLAIPSGNLAGVQALRTKADADTMRTSAEAAGQIVVIGGGYIGLEAAAVLAKSGKSVVLLEALDRVLARVAGSALSQFFEAEHRAHGVEIRLGVDVAAIEGDGQVTGVRLADGELIPADLVLVGIGIVPAVAPLLAAGADGSNGVNVDAVCRTSLEDIYAIGDCAAHPNPFAGGAVIRLESVQNASDQANVVAKGICGDPQAYSAVPWFWSNQYDLKLQTVGLSAGHDETVLRGLPADRSFSLIYLKAGRVIALDCVNAVKDYVQGRALVIAGATIPPALLADPNCPLKSHLAVA